ncbi:uncharacterized protein [Halyomorpha halys]|uniref:uncharacterized protein n=1 Tax=Halyomorpha halys TaxID=286706 RepID=UPI0006D51666|nr:glycine-rich cell wall structural protein-like [Halyomorpha halys]
MNKIFFISLASIVLADEIKEEPSTRTSRGILLGSSGSDGGYGASFYGKSDGLSYSSDPGQYGFGGGHYIGSGMFLGTEGSYPVHSFGDGGIGSHNFVGHALNEYNHGGLSLGEGSGHHFSLGGVGSIGGHNFVGGDYENSYEGGEYRGHEEGHEDGHEGSAVSLNIHGDSHVHETTKAVPVHKTLKIPVHHPVHQAIKIPVPVKVPVPYAIQIPIPVQVEKTVNVPVEKVIPYPVEKPIPFKVVKKVPVPVSKPYPVPYPVYKVRYVYHTKKIHHGHHHHGHHY